MPCTGGSAPDLRALEELPDPDEPEDEEERRLLAPRAATERLEPLRAELLRRVVVARPLAMGVTSTVAEEAAESEEAATALEVVLFFAPVDIGPEALPGADVLAAAADDAEVRRRGAGLAMGCDEIDGVKDGNRSATHPASSGR